MLPVVAVKFAGRAAAAAAAAWLQVSHPGDTVNPRPGVLLSGSRKKLRICPRRVRSSCGVSYLVWTLCSSSYRKKHMHNIFRTGKEKLLGNNRIVFEQLVRLRKLKQPAVRQIYDDLNKTTGRIQTALRIISSIPGSFELEKNYNLSYSGTYKQITTNKISLIVQQSQRGWNN